MTRRDNTNSDKPKTKPNDRETRLKAALKANLARRKAQSRARTAPTDNHNEQNGNKD